MGDPKGFMTVPRTDANYRPVKERVYDYGEVEQTLNEKDRQLQASRCMDCGVAYCNYSCPLGNVLPDLNALVKDGHWHKALDVLHKTNNFPEFTGRLCPALCEASCTLGINEEPVITI